jgi:hypothetical protein
LELRVVIFCLEENINWFTFKIKIKVRVGFKPTILQGTANGPTEKKNLIVIFWQIVTEQRVTEDFVCFWLKRLLTQRLSMQIHMYIYVHTEQKMIKHEFLARFIATISHQFYAHFLAFWKRDTFQYHLTGNTHKIILFMTQCFLYVISSIQT